TPRVHGVAARVDARPARAAPPRMAAAHRVGDQARRTHGVHDQLRDPRRGVPRPRSDGRRGRDRRPGGTARPHPRHGTRNRRALHLGVLRAYKEASARPTPAATVGSTRLAATYANAPRLSPSSARRNVSYANAENVVYAPQKPLPRMVFGVAGNA